MREVTDEMIEAFGEAWEQADAPDLYAATDSGRGARRRAGLEAVFALIERDSPTAAVNPEWAAQREAERAALDEEIAVNLESGVSAAQNLTGVLNDYSKALHQGNSQGALAAATVVQALVARETAIFQRVWVLEDRRQGMGF